MKRMKVNDNGFINKDAFAIIPALTEKIADKTLEELEKEGVFVFPDTVGDLDGMERDQVILQSVNETFRTGNVMGFIGIGDERLAIQSRFSKGEEDFFTQYMLDEVLDMPNLAEYETDLGKDHQLFSFLMFLFPRYLKSAMRKGPYKTYIRRNYNDQNARGTIDIARHIKENTPFIGNIAYGQREYSYDNDLMELIRHTIEYISEKPFGAKLLNEVKDEVQTIFDLTAGYRRQDRQKIIEINARKPLSHAYYREYHVLQHLCILILTHQKHSIGAGTRQIYGVLFDGAWLWEEYINKLICTKFYHPMNKASEGTQYLFYKARGPVYPDFISIDDHNRIIADAKYKPIDNVHGRDFLQVLAYMFRFDAKKGYYFYPEAGADEDQTLRLNRGSSYEHNVEQREDVSVIKHGLKIPDETSNYTVFMNQMKIEEENFKEALQLSNLLWESK